MLRDVILHGPHDPNTLLLIPHIPFNTELRNQRIICISLRTSITQQLLVSQRTALHRTTYRTVAAGCDHEARGKRLYTRNRAKAVGFFPTRLFLDLWFSFLSSRGGGQTWGWRGRGLPLLHDYSRVVVESHGEPRGKLWAAFI